MTRQRSDLRILLLQIRDAPRVRREEHASFAGQALLEPGQIDVLNVFDSPRFPAAAADDYDALFVGGASEASVLEPETYDFVPYCFTVFKEKYTENDDQLKQVLDGARETPESNRLVTKLVDRVLLEAEGVSRS